MAICHGSLRKLTETRSQCPAFASLYGSRQSSSSTCFLWICFTELIKFCPHDFPWWLSGKESACNAGDPGLIPGSGRSSRGGNGNLLQDSSLEKPMDRGAWWATVSVQFSSVAQSCPTLCDPMNCNTPGLPVHHQLPEFTQTHVHRVGDAIQPSHPLSSPSPPVPNPSQHESLFQ